MRQMSDKLRLRDILQDPWPVLKTVKVMENEERLKNCHRPVETKEKKITKHSVVSWIASWNRKRTLMEKLVKSK